jgi:hypothetical protein
MLFSYVPCHVTVMVLGCPDYLQLNIHRDADDELLTAWEITDNEVDNRMYVCSFLVLLHAPTN